jgi:APA family basic amino acid/polyamine antiporter
MLNLSVETWIRFLVWLVIGMVVYLGYGHRNARLSERATASSGAAARS